MYSGRRKKKSLTKMFLYYQETDDFFYRKMHLLRHKSSRSCFDMRIWDCGDVQSWIITLLGSML